MKWYEKYPKLNSTLFTVKNSGKYHVLMAPYTRCFTDDNSDLSPVKNYPDIENWEIEGYTFNPPYFSIYNEDNCVAIMFHNKNTGEKVWFHYMKYFEF